MFVNRGAISENPAMKLVSHVTESEHGQAIHFSSLREVDDSTDTAEPMLQLAQAGK
jgi:hypothetical protein